MGAALAVVEEAAGEEAVRQTVRLVVIEGGAAAAESAVAGEVAVAGGAVVAGEAAAGSAVAIGLGGVLAATGIGLAVVGLAALGYYLYKKHQAPANRELVTPCPKAAAPSVASSAPTATPSAVSVPSAAPAHGRKDRNCDPDDCERAKEAIRDLLKGGRTEKRPLKERIDQLRENPEGQPYDYPVDPATGKHPPSEGGTVKGHLDAIINQTIRANEAIQTYYECGCTGLDESEIRELGNILSEDPLEGVRHKEPNYNTPAERLDWLRRIGKRP